MTVEFCEDRFICWAATWSLPRAVEAKPSRAIVFMKTINRRTPNKRAGGKGGIPSLFHIERARPALPQHHRSTKKENLWPASEFTSH